MRAPPPSSPGNIAALGAAGATLRRGTVAAVLAAGTERPVDLVLADPPYDVDAVRRSTRCSPP